MRSVFSLSRPFSSPFLPRPHPLLFRLLSAVAISISDLSVSSPFPSSLNFPRQYHNRQINQKIRILQNEKLEFLQLKMSTPNSIHKENNPIDITKHFNDTENKSSSSCSKVPSPSLSSITHLPDAPSLFLFSPPISLDPSLIRHTPTRPIDFSSSWQWFRSLGSPSFIVAPMVNQSELAFRILCRKYNSHLCYTPMLHAEIFGQNEHYREEFTTCVEDSPLIAQFCANDPLKALRAAKLIEPFVSAIDINLGCPQGIAKKGHYGSFLLNEPDIICSILSTLYDHITIPITAKIRILPKDEDTLSLVKRIEQSGCSLLTVHGRTKECIKDKVGGVNLDIIKKIKSIMNIPVIANGGVETLDDVKRIMDYTKCDGVMTSEGILCNPSLFTGKREDSIQISKEYLQLVNKYPAHSSAIRSHLFKFLFRELSVHTDLRERLGICREEEFPIIVNEIESRGRTEEKVKEKEKEKGKFDHFPTWYNRHLKSGDGEEVGEEKKGTSVGNKKKDAKEKEEEEVSYDLCCFSEDFQENNNISNPVEMKNISVEKKIAVQ